MAEVLLVIWSQWSRKPSDREISVSVRERANGKRQQENEKRAALPRLRLEMELCKRMRSPSQLLAGLSKQLLGLCLGFFPWLYVHPTVFLEQFGIRELSWAQHTGALVTLLLGEGKWENCLRFPTCIVPLVDCRIQNGLGWEEP